MSKFILNSKQEIISSAKSAFSINFPFYVFALGILLAFSAFQCENIVECQEPSSECSGGASCEVLHIANITVEDVICGTGVWENSWFNDGSKIYLQPYSISDEAKAQLEKSKIEIKNGLRLKITYQHTKKDGRYDNVVICQAYVGESTLIYISSVEIINN